MATAKNPTAKTPAKKTAKKATEVKSVADLQKDLTAKQNDLLEAKRSHHAGDLVNPRILTTTRKEIARLHTAIRAAVIKEQKESK